MSVRENVIIIGVLLILMLSMVLVNMTPKCKKNEVRVNGKCYVPGVKYINFGGVEKMI